MTRILVPFAILSLFVAGLGGQGVQARYPPHDEKAVELATVQSLIFRSDSKTTGRRTSPVPQLTCVGGGACGSGAEPQVVHCTNIGVDYANGDPTWKCTAELENGVRLGTTDVICEGFRDRDDPYILRGSCGLEYTLTGTPVRVQQQQQQQQAAASASAYQEKQGTYQQNKPYTASSVPPHKATSKRSWANWLVGGFLIWLVLRYLNRPASATASRASTASTGQTPGGGGFFGGGGGPFGGEPWRSQSVRCGDPQTCCSGTVRC